MARLTPIAAALVLCLTVQVAAQGPPCGTAASQASAAVLRAAQQRALQQRGLLRGAATNPDVTVTRVASWQELAGAVAEHDGSSLTVFELQAAGQVVASTTLQLRPGMHVVAGGSQRGSQLKVTCGDGVKTAFDVALAPATATAAPTPASAANVVLQGLHISDCSGSAVTVSGRLRAADVALGQLPPGLHLLDATLSDNRAEVGAGIRASQAAVYLDAVYLQGNAAGRHGAGVAITQGVLVAARSRFVGNSAGQGAGKLRTEDQTPAAALYANSSSVSLLNTTVSGNTGRALGGCAVHSTGSRGFIAAGCKFSGNACAGDGLSVAGAEFGSVDCASGGVSLMVTSDMPPLKFEQAPKCALATKHLVHISDSSFGGDAPMPASCGGSVMADRAWLELQRCAFTNTSGNIKGAAFGARDSVVVVRGSRFDGLTARANGGAVSTLRCGLWAVDSTFANTRTEGAAGGCISAVDSREVDITRCTFDGCTAAETGGALFADVPFDEPANPPPVALRSARFRNCKAYREGAAASLHKSNITIVDTVFDSNEGYYGGVINSNRAPLSVARSRFVNNRASAGGQGGTLYAQDNAAATFTDCLWYNNSAYQGAAVYGAAYGGESEWVFERCNFTANVAEQRAGALWLTGVNATFTDTVFAANEALLAAAVYATSTGTQLPQSFAFDACSFERNAAHQSAAVAWLVGIGAVSMSDCSVRGNTAGQSAAGLHLQNAPTKLASCVFAGNRARLASAMMLTGANSTVAATNCSFEGNQASDQAGVGLLMDGSQLTLARTSCSNNTAASAGGAFVVLDGAKLACSGRCRFTANSAALGGAIAAQSAAVALTDAVLASNTAPGDLVTVGFGNSQQRAGSGGALFAANATVQLRSSSFRANTADQQGGALQLVSSRAVAVGTSFVGNRAAVPGDTAAAAANQRATAGGAIAVGLLPSTSSGNKTQAAVLSLQRCTLSDNSAGFGGAVAAINAEVDLQAPAPSDTSPAVSAGAAAPVSISLNDSVASNNTAAVAGGGLFSNLPGAAISISGSKVLSNTAGRGGGGLAAVTPASLTMASSSVSSNTAAYCGGLLLDTPAKDSRVQGSRFEGNTAGQLDAEEAAAEGRQLRASSESSFGQLPTWNNTGSGGGMCVAPGGVVSVTKSVITKNAALHGAGMFVQDCVSRQGQSPKQDLRTSISRQRSACRVVVGSQTVISGNSNEEGGSGSAFYTTDTAAVNVAPDARAGRVSKTGSQAGDSVASKPSAVLGGFQASRVQSEAGGSRAQPVLLVQSGASLPAVQLRLVDQMGQPLPDSLLQKLTFRAQATAITNASQSDTNLLGVTSVVPAAANSGSNGSLAEVQFDSLELQGAPGATFNVSFGVLEAPDVAPAVVQVKLQECKPGQAVLRGRGTDLFAGCTNCTTPLFSFDPAAPECSTCPPPDQYSVCSGGVITPADGFWQSNPRSSQLLACPNPAACSRSPKAAAALAAASKAAAAAAAPQAASRGLKAVASAQVAAYQGLQCAEGFTGNLCSNCERSSRVTQTYAHTCRACSVSRVGSTVLFVLVRLFDLAVVLLSVFLVVKERQRRHVQVNSGAVTPDALRTAAQHGVQVVPSATGQRGPVEMKPVDEQHGLVAASNIQVDTYLMMFIEFMQLLSIFRLTRIGVVWRSAAEAVLLAMSITPISSYSWMSLECVLRAALAPQQYAYATTLASTYIPVALVAVVCCLVLLKNLLRAKRLGFAHAWAFPPLKPELLLAAVKAIAYGYPVVTGSVLTLFSCKQLDRASSTPGEVTSALGNFWVRDLDTACFQGSHLTYALAVGLPMLVLVVLYPLLVAALLTRQARRGPDGLYDVGYWANYSMLYQDYTPAMHLWGSVRELRQLLLIAVVVVLQAYPVQLQMVGGWVLSLLLLGSHAALMPFRTRLLNGLQMAMLAAISFTFYAGVLASVAGVSGGAVAALQFIAVALNIAVALVLLGVLLWRAHLWFDYDNDGKVTWADIKHTVRHGSDAVSKVTSAVYSSKKVGALTSSRTSGGPRIAAGPVAPGTLLSSADSGSIVGIDALASAPATTEPSSAA